MEIINNIINLFDKNPIGQTIGFFGFLIGIIAFLHKKDKNLYILMMIGNIFWIIHFSFMGMFSGAAVNFVSFLRGYVTLKYKRNIFFLFLFIFLYIIIGILLYKNIYSLLPIVAGILGTIAFIWLSGLKSRLVLFMCSFLWLLYNYIGGSIGGIITELFMLIAGAITIYRLLIENKNKKNV